MSFVLRTVALAATLAITASAQFPNSTASPSAIDVLGWKYQSCGFPCDTSEFELVETSSAMTIERCLLDCSAYEYAEIHGNECYCSQTADSVTTVGDGQCSLPCPGDPSEACGGIAGALVRRARRGYQARSSSDSAASSTGDSPCYGYGCPASSTAYPSSTSSSSPVQTTCPTQPGQSYYSLYKKAIVPEGQIYITVITNIYIDVCPTCPGGTSTCTASSTATLTGCGCTNPVLPTIPMATTTATCDSCDEYVITITTPCEHPTPYYPTTSTITVAPISSNYPVLSSTWTPSPAAFTGAAANVQAGMGMAGALVLAGLAIL